MDYFELQKLAKAELHCHLDGSISMQTIRQLADLAMIDLPENDEELKSLITAPETIESLMDYLKTFDFIRPLLQSKEALSLAAYDVAKQAAMENVIYLEVRFAPELSMDKGLSASDTVEAVLDGLKKAEQDFGIVARVLVCGLKQSDPSLTLDIFENIIHLAKKGLVGFDFAGNEADFPTEMLSNLIQQTQNLGLPMTFHAGECGCVSNILTGIELGISRFGHSTALVKDPDAIAKFVKAGATAEMCLTSNLQTKAAKTIDDFPYFPLYQAGANITINTDNRTVSDTNLTKEYALCNKYFGTQKKDFYQFNQAAIKASFASEREKELLLSKLEKAYLVSGNELE